MKTRNLLLKLMLSIMPGLAFSQSFGPISVASNLGQFHPQIEIAPDGKPLVLWTDGIQCDIYLARFNGTNFDTPVQLDPPGLDVQGFD